MVQADDAKKRRVHRGTASRVGTNPKALETRTTFPIPYSVLNLTGSVLGTDMDHIGDDVKLYLDTAKTKYIGYNSAIGQLVWGDIMLASPGPLDIYSNCGEDAAGQWSPWISMLATGQMLIGSDDGAAREIHLQPYDFTWIGQAANHVKVTTAGVLTLAGTARVYNNLRIWPAAVRLPAANFPAGGTVSVFDVLDFDDTTEESCYVDVILPYRREAGTDVTVSVYWHSAAATAGDCIWGIEYRAIADSDAVAGATTTVEQAFTTDATAGDLNLDTFTTKILAANIDDKNMMGMRLYRKAADALDTLVGDARCLGLNLEFTSDKLGKAL